MYIGLSLICLILSFLHPMPASSANARASASDSANRHMGYLDKEGILDFLDKISNDLNRLGVVLKGLPTISATTGPSTTSLGSLTTIPGGIVTTTSPDDYTPLIPPGNSTTTATTTSPGLNTPSTTFPNSNVTVTFSPELNVTTTTSAQGNMTSPEGNMTTLIYPESNTTTTTFPESNMTTTTFPEVNMTTTTSPEVNMTSPEGNMTTTTFPEGNMTTTTSPEVNMTSPEGNMTTTTSPEVNMTSPEGNMTTTTSPEGNMTTTTFPDMTTTTSPEVNMTSPEGNMTTTTSPEGNMTTTTFPEGNMTTTTSPEGNMTTTTIPEVNMTSPEGNITTTTFPEGNMTTTTSPEVNMTSPEGNMTTTTFTETNMTMTTIPEANMTTTTSPKGNTTTMTTPEGKMTTTSPDGNTTSPEINMTTTTSPEGNMTTTISLEGNTISPEGSMTTATSPEGNMTRTTSPEGNTTTATSPEGNTTSPESNMTTTSSPEGNTTTTTSPEGNTISPGNMTTTTSPEGYMTTTTSTESNMTTTTSPEGNTTSPEGNTNSTTYPEGNSTTVTFPTGNLSAVSSPESDTAVTTLPEGNTNIAKTPTTDNSITTASAFLENIPSFTSLPILANHSKYITTTSGNYGATTPSFIGSASPALYHGTQDKNVSGDRLFTTPSSSRIPNGTLDEEVVPSGEESLDFTNSHLPYVTEPSGITTQHSVSTSAADIATENTASSQNSKLQIPILKKFSKKKRNRNQEKMRFRRAVRVVPFASIVDKSMLQHDAFSTHKSLNMQRKQHRLIPGKVLYPSKKESFSQGEWNTTESPVDSADDHIRGLAHILQTLTTDLQDAVREDAGPSEFLALMNDEAQLRSLTETLEKSNTLISIEEKDHLSRLTNFTRMSLSMAQEIVQLRLSAIAEAGTRQVILGVIVSGCIFLVMILVWTCRRHRRTPSNPDSRDNLSPERNFASPATYSLSRPLSQSSIIHSSNRDSSEVPQPDYATSATQGGAEHGRRGDAMPLHHYPSGRPNERPI